VLEQIGETAATARLVGGVNASHSRSTFNGGRP
jgi:hypothetical protein